MFGGDDDDILRVDLLVGVGVVVPLAIIPAIVAAGAGIIPPGHIAAAVADFNLSGRRTSGRGLPR